MAANAEVSKPIPSSGAGAYLRAILFGAMGALIGGAIWYFFVTITEIQFGLIATIVGFAAGFGIVLGRGGARLPGSGILAAALTLVAVVVSHYFIVMHILGDYLAEQGSSAAAIGLVPLEMTIGLAVKSVAADPLTLLFWGIAAYAAYRVATPKDAVPEPVTAKKAESRK